MAMKGVYKTGASASLSALPAGYLQAATLPGKHIAKGIEKWGEEIGGAIEEYHKTKAESDFVNQEFTDLQKYLDDLTEPGGGAAPGDWGAQAQGAAQNEEFAKDIATYMQGSLSQRKAKVMDLKFRISQFYKDRSFGLEQDRFNLAEDAEERAERGQKDILRSRRVQEKQARVRLQLSQEEAELGRQDTQAMQTALGANMAPDVREFVPPATLINRGIREAGTMAGVQEINKLRPDPVDPTMGQNVAAARSYFQSAQMPPLPGLRPDNMLTEALKKWGTDKNSVDQIVAEFDSHFGPAESSKIGQTIMLPGDNMGVFTSPNQIQIIYPQDGKGGVSAELQNVLGDFLEGDLQGSDARMRMAMDKIGAIKDLKLRGKLLTEYLDLRKKVLGSMAGENFTMDSVSSGRLKTLYSRMDTYKRAMEAEDDETKSGEWLNKIIQTQKAIEDVHKDARQRQKPATGAPTRQFVPGQGFITPRQSKDR